MADYVFNGSGPATVLGGVEAIGFISTKFANVSLKTPDIQFHITSGTFASADSVHIANTQGVGNEMWKRYFKPLTNTDAFTILPVLIKPKSVGNLKLKSKNPFAKPILNAGYFSHPDDIKVLVEGNVLICIVIIALLLGYAVYFFTKNTGIKFGLELGKTKSLEKFGTELYGAVMPGCEHTELHSDDYWECLCRQQTSTFYHYSGTAKMGPEDDPGKI